MGGEGWLLSKKVEIGQANRNGDRKIMFIIQLKSLMKKEMSQRMRDKWKRQLIQIKFLPSGW